jgi:hypothetical protein
MSVKLNDRQRHRYAGTYRVVNRVHWEGLKAQNFGNPDWAALYPIKANGQPAGLLTPRLACKLFTDGVFILDKTTENPKYLQDKLPNCTHKYYKKKQWRKQLLEGAKRVLCRVAKGKSFSPNCSAEDMFVFVLLASANELGWNRSRAIWENLPESDKDRDMGRLVRMGSSEDIGALFRAEGAPENVNFKDWFRATNNAGAALSDHLLGIEGEEVGHDDDEEDD